MDNVIMDHIADGHFDRELGEITRDPKYAEYTAIEIKAILTDRISDNMLPTHHYGLRWPLRVLVGLLVGLVAVALIGCSPEIREPLTNEEINSTIAKCARGKLLTHIVVRDMEIVEIYCTPDKGD